MLGPKLVVIPCGFIDPPTLPCGICADLNGGTLRQSPQISGQFEDEDNPGFAYIPRSVTTRITSSSRVEITPEGEVVMTIENKGAEVDNEYIYVPSKTRMTGRRIGEAGLAGIPKRKSADTGANEE